MQLARTLRLLTLLAIALVRPSADAASQAARDVLAGRVVKNGAPVSGVAVTLHHVSAQASGAVGEQASGADGAFAFRLPPPDTSAFNVYFVSVDHLGVRYFGEAVHRNEVPATYDVAVYDTASSVPGAVRLSRRYLVLLQETDGSWSANEAIKATNASDRSLVSASGAPTWEFRIPEGATDFEVTEGLVAEGELQLMGDRALFMGSLPPGSREVVVRYRLPADGRDVEIPTVTDTDTFYVFVPEGVGDVRITGLSSTQIVPVDDQRFVRYGGTDIAPGQVVALSWKSGAPPADPVIAGVLAAVVVLGAGGWMAARNRGAPPRRPGRASAA